MCWVGRRARESLLYVKYGPRQMVHCPCRGYRTCHEDGYDVGHRVVDDGEEGDGEKLELGENLGDIFASKVSEAVRGS